MHFDITTFKLVTALLIGIWSRDANDHYGGVSTAGESSLANYFLSCVQLTDTDGVVAFGAIYPGHYIGRTIHEHMVTHTGAAVSPNWYKLAAKSPIFRRYASTSQSSMPLKRHVHTAPTRFHNGQ